MGIYLRKLYEKDKSDNWKLTSTIFEKIPHTEKYWRKNQKAEEKSSLHEYSFFHCQKNGDIDNWIVDKVVTYFPNEIKVERELISTSNTIPKKFLK